MANGDALHHPSIHTQGNEWAKYDARGMEELQATANLSSRRDVATGQEIIQILQNVVERKWKLLCKPKEGHGLESREGEHSKEKRYSIRGWKVAVEIVYSEVVAKVRSVLHFSPPEF